ncbi:hypothetical protein TTRE_0000849401 [Trichuris trichiura]|uniref:Uncharacterized protein n=1 Tax=Trichuris trichiura TaxID=36087 RepID=A0A077ZKE8_TRITR|nr:hypothetical protein TTRE_0000849401 [Trichuris trichiura]
MALNGGTLQGQGVYSVWLQPTARILAKADVIVSRRKPFGFDFIVGMKGIKALGGVQVDANGRAHFGLNGAMACATKEADIRLEEPHFSVVLNRAKRHWTASWKWRNSMGGSRSLEERGTGVPPSEKLQPPI